MPTLLIANRGEIALRIMRTAKECGYTTLAIYSDADRHAPHVSAADRALPIGGNTPQESYLHIEKVIAAAHRGGARSVHPGYGFLSENAEFARACEQAGLTFIGPSAAVIELMGNKRRAKAFAREAGVPCIPGYQGSEDMQQLIREAEKIGYPLMLKAAAGGGGRGMRTVQNAEEFEPQLRSARAESLTAFGSDEIILEKVLNHARHIEIQVFADQHGNCVYLGERDCSVQRRHQKVVEEAPSPAVSTELREEMGRAAVALATACEYTGAGTVEFLLDSESNFYFLEMNTRLQVEHGVTELITGTDLVAWQLAVAEGAPLPQTQAEIQYHGHAIEVRLYAEDPEQGFLPQSGRILTWQASPALSSSADARQQLRFDHALAENLEISPYYDPMLGKLMAWGGHRDEARARLSRALDELVLLGPRNNRFFLKQVIDDPTFAAGAAHTGFLAQQFTPLEIASASRSEARAIGCALLHHLAISESDQRRGRANWQSGGFPAPRNYRLSDDDGEFETSLAATASFRYQVSLAGGEPLTVDLSEIPVGKLAASPRARSAVWVDGCQHAVLWFMGQQRAPNLSLIFAQRQWEISDLTYSPAQIKESQGNGLIRAPMEGNLTQVYVEAGASVARGDLLATMEAMKMEHALKADCDGVVRTVEAEVGGQVKSGQILFHVDVVTHEASVPG